MRSSLFLLIGILLLASALRLLYLSELPGSLYIDEVAMVVDARSVAATGADMHGNHWLQPIFASYGDYKLAPYILSVAGLMTFFGDADWLVRVPSALAGILTVGGVYWLAVRLGRTFAVSESISSLFAPAAALAVAISPWGVLFSRAGFEGNLAQMLLIYSLIFSTYFPRWWAIIASLICGLFATYTYFSVQFIFIGIIWWYVVTQIIGNYFQKGWIKLSKQLVFAVISLSIGYFLLLLPLTQSSLFESMEQYRFSTPSLLQSDEHILRANEYRELSNNSVASRVFFHRYWFWLQNLIEHVSAHLTLSYVFLEGDQNLRHGTGVHGLFLWPFLLPFLLGLYTLARRYWSLLLFLLGWWLLAIMPGAMTFEIPHALRTLNGLAAVALIIGFGLANLIDYCLRALQMRKVPGMILGVVFIFLVIASFSEFVWYYAKIYPLRVGNAWFQDEQNSAEKLSSILTEEKVIVQWPRGKWFLWYQAYVNPQWYDSDSSTAAYQFTTIGNVEIVSSIDDAITEEAAILLAPTKELTPFLDEANWQIEVEEEISHPTTNMKLLKVIRHE